MVGIKAWLGFLGRDMSFFSIKLPFNDELDRIIDAYLSWSSNLFFFFALLIQWESW